MIYTSSNGCLFYYDRILYKWSFADPTMLFLLGFDSIMTFDNSVSNYIIIPKEYQVSSTNKKFPLNGFDIFDKIVNYLYQLGSVEDFGHYLKFDCYGLKLLINDLTGMGSDRTVPIIFNNDINKKLINVTKSTYRISDDDRINLSYYDIQAKIIKNIFEDAGYNKDQLDLIDIDDVDNSEISYAHSYNDSINAIYNEKINNKNVFKLLDYSSMYSYSLGVLYGCKCLGYDSSYIWKIEPKYWYNGIYTNLVSTAWTVFRFYHTSFLDEFEDNPEASVQYQNITYNRLWNFDKTGIVLMMDELPCYILNISLSDIDNINIQTSKVPDPASFLHLQKAYYSKHLIGEYDISSIIINSNDPRNFEPIQCFGSNIPIDGEFKWNVVVFKKSEIEGGDDTEILNCIATTSTSTLSNTTLLDFEYSEDSEGHKIVPDGHESDDVLTALRYIAAAYSNYYVTISIKINDGDSSRNILVYSDFESVNNYYVSPAGKYMIINKDLSWEYVSDLLSSEDRYGIIDADYINQPIIRYIANDKVRIYPAHKWYSDQNGNFRDMYLSPNYTTENDQTHYFISTGALGWVDFNINDWKSHIAGHLQISPTSYSKLDSSFILKAHSRIQEEQESDVFVYKCEVNNKGTYIYGIFNTVSETDDGYDFSKTSNHFKYILSEKLFNTYYTLA